MASVCTRGTTCAFRSSCDHLHDSPGRRRRPGTTEARAIPGKPRTEKAKKFELSGKATLIDRVVWTSEGLATELLVFEDSNGIALLEIREDPGEEHPRVSGARVPRLLFNAEIVIAGMDEEATKRGAKMIERGAWRHVTPNERIDGDDEEADGADED